MDKPDKVIGVNATLMLAETEYPIFARAMASMDTLRALLEEVSEVDAEPVRHGRWSDEIGDIHSTGKFRVCSICGEGAFVPYFTRQGISHTDYDFCPNCGATMDAKEDM